MPLGPTDELGAGSPRNRASSWSTGDLRLRPRAGRPRALPSGHGLRALRLPEVPRER